MSTAYLAGRYGTYPLMQERARELGELGITVTARWIQGDHQIRAGGEAEADHWSPVWALEDLEDLTRADMVISFTEGPGDVAGRARGGRHVEYGVALAMEKRNIVIGYRENVFHWLPGVEFYPTWAEALAALSPRGSE